MKKILLLAALFASANIYAQSIDPVGDFNKHSIANWNGTYHRVSQYRVKGSPYLFGQSFWGTIDYKGGKTVKGIKVLYDLNSQASGIDLKNNEIFEAEQGVERFTVDLPQNFGGKTLTFVNADMFTTGYTGYYNLLADGEKAALLKAYKIKLQPDMTNQMAKDIRVFEQYYEYYIFNKATKQLSKIKLKEKDILDKLNATSLAKDYIKAKSLDVSEENDAIKFFTGYNANFKVGNN